MPNHQISVSRKGFSKLFKHGPPFRPSNRKTQKEIQLGKWENPEKREHAIEKTNYTPLKTLTNGRR